MVQQITYLITAATGFTGIATIAALQANGQQHIRALAHREDERSEQLRQQGIEVVFGDLLNFHAVKAALQGVSRAYFCFPIAPGMVQATAQFRPTFFAEWLLYFSAMIRQGTIYAPYGAGKAAFIAGEDQGRVIAHILQDPQPHQGQVYPLYGPVEYTFAEFAAEVGRVLGKDIRYQQVPFEVMREAFTAGSEQVARNDSLSGYAESNRLDSSGKESHTFQHLREAAIDMDNGLFSGMNDLVERITGRPPLTIEEVVSRYQTAFV